MIESCHLLLPSIYLQVGGEYELFSESVEHTFVVFWPICGGREVAPSDLKVSESFPHH